VAGLVQATVTPIDRGLFDLHAEDGREWRALTSEQLGDVVTRERLRPVSEPPPGPDRTVIRGPYFALPELDGRDIAAVAVAVGCIGGCVLLGLETGWFAGLGLFLALLVLWGGYVLTAGVTPAEAEPPVELPAG
jgi:hypothetical protein